MADDSVTGSGKGILSRLGGKSGAGDRAYASKLADWLLDSAMPAPGDGDERDSDAPVSDAPRARDPRGNRAGIAARWFALEWTVDDGSGGTITAWAYGRGGS